jgi:predicted secreted protein
MNPLTAIAIYLTIWWTVLFGILPLGAKSHAEAGIKPPGVAILRLRSTRG